MSLVPKAASVPPGGWHFDDTSTGSLVRIEGESFNDVAERILKHRLANSVPPGNPAGELAQSICGPYPHFCDDNTPGSNPVIGDPRGPMSRRVASWMASFFSQYGGAEAVSAQVAEERARVCRACPHNVDFNRGGCPSCLSSVQRLSFVWRRDRSTSRQEELKGCDITSQHNPTAVWAPLPAAEGVPMECWRHA